MRRTWKKSRTEYKNATKVVHLGSTDKEGNVKRRTILSLYRKEPVKSSSKFDP